MNVMGWIRRPMKKSAFARGAKELTFARRTVVISAANGFQAGMYRQRTAAASAMIAILCMMSGTTEAPLRYVECAVTMAEAPREISLTLTVSNCAFRCHSCHSPYLQEDSGLPL